MTARHHHYLSQCYLKGFTKGGSKKSKLQVFDLRGKKIFETIPRNVGGIRDFNRIDIKGRDQNEIEKSLATFEGKAASALRKLEETHEFEGDTKDLILNLIALLAVRSPEMREHWGVSLAKIVDQIMGLSLATKECWESQIKQVKESGEDINENVSYEEVRKFHESKKYAITVSREHHIRMEFVGVEAILPLLHARNWLLVKSTDETGPFITTNNPVNLVWKEPDKIPLFCRNSPGYGMNETQVYFPVSKNLGLIGEFDIKERVLKGNVELIAALNSKLLTFSCKQIYAPKTKFKFRWENGEIRSGNEFFQCMKP
ncbi:hypothetical protein MS2017_2117 [Bathymodiolus thermophilus thioautotrophic gill symbiont]|uniref:DUF4238 domain-containing protein n=1 Tax=Bathymodiolus thermophilus thioautotrophic gill symbiont TaxID=2360 RepID=A0A3G3IPZ5_9GAMM|nr:DUF4238 domain-containing protein [Bathymodiolus thermophilus thioautotrophic gill symbiont]AYQ57769.1 hypothetical protein MS2017_2117 [Bathymodiolus thermophilus thioautotrophic gill symbiont]